MQNMVIFMKNGHNLHVIMLEEHVLDYGNSPYLAS